MVAIRSELVEIDTVTDFKIETGCFVLICNVPAMGSKKNISSQNSLLMVKVNH